MNEVGAHMDVVSAVPLLQEKARRANCLEKTLSGELSQVCLYFISQSVHWAVDVHNALGDEVEGEGLVVKVARWAAHNMLFWCGARLLAPFVD